MQLGRRGFIGLLGSAAAGTAIGLPAGRLFDQVLASGDQHIHPPGGSEDFVLSACTACPGGCGVRVRRIGGRIVKLSGNPLHPVSGGRLCAKGQAAIQALHHPDRVLTPLRRVGPRGAIESFEPGSWDQAIKEIAGRLASLRDQKRPEAFVFLHGAGGAGMRLASRFAEVYGSPNDIALDRGSDADALALFLTQGVRATPAYDIRASDYVLSLGCEFLETAPSPVFTARAYGDFRQMRTARRGRFVHVGSRLSPTASSADEWIAIKPGAEGIFALGVAAAIVSERLYDREFIAEHCAGFDDGLRPFLERRFGLEPVALETGVGVNTILRVAREFASSRGIALGPRRGPLLPGRLMDHLAAHTLNALVGNIDQPGGVLVPDSLSLTPPVNSLDAIARTGRAKPRLDGRSGAIGGDAEQLADSLRTGNPYRAEVLMVASSDPLFTTAGDRFRQALAHVPFVVSFATTPNDTALHSDWILPEPHFLEQTDLLTTVPGVPFPSASVALPATAPPAEARSLSSVVLDLSQRLGFEAELPWPDPESFIRSEVDALYGARRGSIMGTPFDEAWVRMMEGAGWWAPGYSSAEELWERSLSAGGWWDPFYDHGDWSRVLRTPSGRFEFRADVFEQLAESSGAAGPQTEGAANDTLALLLFEPLAIAGGSGAELPFLQSILDPGHGGWKSWGEIHPDTAHAMGLRDGMQLRVTSPQASINVAARLTPRVVRGAIAIPVGLGKEGGGRWAAGLGANPLRLIGGTREAVSLLTNVEATRVVVSQLPGKRSRS